MYLEVLLSAFWKLLDENDTEQLDLTSACIFDKISKDHGKCLWEEAAPN